MDFYDCSNDYAVTDLLQRIKIREIRENEWFKKNYIAVKLKEDKDINLDDVRAVFDDAEVGKHCSCC